MISVIKFIFFWRSFTCVLILNFRRAAAKISRVNLLSILRISNKTSPFFTVCDQYRTLPFPLPWRTSFGFFVIGTLGKIQKKIWAFFLRNRLKKRRIASCWKFVILPDSRATNEIQPCLLVLFNDFLVFFIKSLVPEKLFVYFAFCGNKNIIKLCFAGIKPIKLIINRL